MSTIDIRQPHTMTLDAAKEKAQELAKSMEQKLGLTWSWVDDAIQFSALSGAAKGTKGEVRVSPSEIRVTVDLPFMLRVLKGSIESKIHEKLNQLL